MTQLALPPRELTPEERQGSDDQLDKAVQGVFDTALDVFTDRPAFVASDDPVNPLSAAVRAVTRLNCKQWAASDKSGYSPAVNAGNAQICDPYLDTLGLKPEGGFYTKEFEGGQCPVLYTASFSWTQADNGCNILSASNPSLGVGAGPISLSYRNNREGQSSPLCPGFSYNQVLLTNAAGTVVLIGAGRGVALQSFSLSREDGQPDDCGDPPTKYVPPNTVDDPAIGPPQVTINLPGIGDVNVDVTIGPTGQPTFCVEETGTCFDIDVTGGAGEDGEGGDGGGGTPPPGDVGEPGQPEDTGEGGDSEGEAPPGSVLVGLKIDILESPSGARSFAPDVFRAVCYIYMGTPTGLDQDYAGSMLRSGQFVFAEKDNLTSWRVSANLGFNLRTTPYYREVPE